MFHKGGEGVKTTHVDKIMGTWLLAYSIGRDKLKVTRYGLNGCGARYCLYITTTPTKPSYLTWQSVALFQSLNFACFHLK